METKNDSKKTPGRKSKKLLKISAILLLTLILIILFVVPGIISSPMGKDIILGKINSNLAGKADFNKLSMSWFKGIKITNISFKDDKGLIDIAIKQLITKPKYSSLLTGAISLGKTIIDEPVIELITSGKKEQTPSKTQPSEAVPVPVVSKQIGLPVKNLNVTINKGLLKVKSPNNKTTQLSNINSTVNLRSLGQVSTFELNADISDSGTNTSKVTASANIKPSKKSGWTFKGTDGDLNIKIDQLNLESLESLIDLTKIDLQAKGIVTGNLDASIKDGQINNLKAVLNAQQIDITGGIIKGDHIHAKQVSLALDLVTDKDVINIKDLTLSSDWANAKIKGSAPTKLTSIKDSLSSESAMNLNGNFDVDVAAVLSQLPNTIGLRKGLIINSGKLTGSIDTKTQAGKRILSSQINLTDLAGKLDAKDIKLSQPITAKINLSSDKSNIYYDNVDISSGFCKVNCSGTSELLNYNADIDLAKLQAELGQFMETKQNFAGKLISKGQIATTKDKITTKGSSKITNLVITTPQRTASEPAANIDFVAVIDKKQNILNINSLKIDATKLGKINIENGSLPLKESAASTKMDIIADIDLASIQPFAALSGLLPKDLQIAGQAKSKLSINSSKKVYHISTNSTHINNLKIQKKDKKPFEQTTVDLKFDAIIDTAQKNIQVKSLELISPQIKITKGQYTQQTSKAGITTISGIANCQYDWQAISNISSQFLPQGFNLKGQRNDTFKFNSTYPADKPDLLMANLNSSINTGFETADYMGFYFGKTDLSVDIKKGIMNIKPFTSTVNKGTLSFAGSADFNKTPALLKTPGTINIFKDIQINDETTKRLLKYVNPIFADAVNVTGVINFNCEKMVIPLAKDATKDIELIGTMAINNMRLQASNVLSQILDFTGISKEQIITIRPTKFTVADEILRYDDMPMEVGKYPLNFKGTVNIGPSKQLNMDILMPYTTAGKTIKVGETSEAPRITLPIKGTVNRPKIDFDKLLENQIKDQLENVLKDVLKDVFK